MFLAFKGRPSIPLFSIVVVHYQGVNPHDIFMRGYESIARQKFKGFELLCYHDGPLLDTSVKFPVDMHCTSRRHGDWGHSLRDLGIRKAQGEYILHFNADNILYPDALEKIAEEITRPPRLYDQVGHPLDTNDIVIFPIKMWNLIKFRNITRQLKGPPKHYIVLTGIPPVLQYIDCMQLVMKRSLWLAEGGWHDKRELGDGYMYQQFAAKYGYRTVGPILGEHF
ncbi:MAG: glycosyltransferase [Sinobacteraceae bacterium]|nr:glycosyltransferase [Nevskiaceae bacterium]